jgi:hypothetical protein
MESIENVIDAWLVEKLTESIGTGSDYATLKVKRIEAAILRTQKDWESWTLPGIGIATRIEQWQADEHIGGNIVLSNNIPYVLTIVVNGEEATAISNARTILARLKDALKTFHADVGALTTDTDEQVERVYFFKSRHAEDAGRIRLRKYDDVKNGGMKYIAIDLSVVITTIGG